MLPTATKPTTLFSLETFKEWIGVTSSATKAISSLTSVGTVATAVSAGHGYQTGAFVQIAGASPAVYNGGVLLTRVDANTFTYPLASAPGGPATGTPTVTVDDGRYATMANAASDEIEQAIGVNFVTRSVTDTFSGDDKPAHALRYAPVVSLDAVTIDGGEIDPSTYGFDADSGIVSGAFSGATIVVTYTAGYDVQDGPKLPSDIYRAGLDLAKAIHDELVSNTIAATSVSLGASTMVIKAADYPPSVKRVIQTWSGAGYRA